MKKEIINKFSNQLSIETSLSFEEKKKKLEQNNIFIATYTDVLNFADKTVEIEDFDNIISELNLTQHIEVLQKAINVQEIKNIKIRKEEEEWLLEIAKEFFGHLLNSDDIKVSLERAKNKLTKARPNLEL